MDKFTILDGIAAPMPMANITTDSMSPSAAGRSTAVDLGAMLFANMRYDAEGKEVPEFVLNRAPFRRSTILVAGPNFGCGSSRERAVWALMRFGIRCVIAPSFGDIFHDNALQNGLLPVKLSAADCSALIDWIDAAAKRAQEPRVTVDLERCLVERPDGHTVSFSVSPEWRTALLEGLDEISVILRMEADIDAFQRADAKRRPWIYLER